MRYAAGTVGGGINHTTIAMPSRHVDLSREHSVDGSRQANGRKKTRERHQAGGTRIPLGGGDANYQTRRRQGTGRTGRFEQARFEAFGELGEAIGKEVLPNRGIVT